MSQPRDFGFETDDSRHPVVIVRAFGTPNDDHLAQFLDGLDKLLKERRGPHALIFDLSRAPSPPAHHRRAMAAWMKSHEAVLKASMAGIAFVFTSAVFRFVLSTIFLIQPLPCPHTVCGNEKDALAWAGERLAKFKARAERNK